MSALIYPDGWPMSHLLGSLQEMWVQGDYNGITIPADGTVIDAGANIGIVTMAVAPLCRRVWALEPVPELWGCLVDNLEINHVDNVTACQIALGNRNGNATLHLNQRNPFAASAVNDLGEGDMVVPMVTLKHFLEDHKITHVDFLKLDIEGAEHQVVLAKEFAEVAPSIDTIFMEVHYYDPMPMFKRLEDLGYRVMWRGLATHDCRIFTRKDRRKGVPIKWLV